MKNWKIVILTLVLFISLCVVILMWMKPVWATVSTHDIPFSPMEVSDPDSVAYENGKPANIIVFIADGLGFAHLSLAQLTQSDANEASVWQSFDVRSWHDARAAFGPLTDSGASGTAMATGSSTNFAVIGQDAGGNNVSSAMEDAANLGYATGIVTDSYIWDATPAAFVAHTDSRDNARDILEQLAASRLDVLFGELEDVGEEEVPEYDETIEILQRRFAMLDRSLAAPKPDSMLTPLAAVFEEDEIQDLDSDPTLVRMTKTALNYLSSNNRPFFLMVESEEMDSGSHKNDSERVTKSLRAIEETLKLLVDFSKANGKTLLLFTSDHETGGLAIVTKEGAYPDLQLVWSSKDHTASVVPLLAHGPGADHFADIQRNWQIGTRLKSLIGKD